MTKSRPSEDLVRAQYEAHPYPPKRDGDESADIAQGCLDSLSRLNHYLWGGEAVFDDGFRILVAGGGTGDATVRLTRQLCHLGRDFSLIHLDLSEASMSIARQRLERYGLTDRVTFVRASLLDLPDMDLKPFDYINCSGVLHHLDSPDDGLKALASKLSPGGGMGIMLYGDLGRSGIYDIQEVMRHLGQGLPGKARIDLARRLLSNLPATNRLKTNPLGYGGDPAALDDADIVDLFLHPRDRPYRVPDVLALLKGAGMEICAFTPPWIYRPDWLMDDPLVAAQLRLLPPAEGAAAAELIAGAIPTHSFFAKTQGKALPAPGWDEETIPIPANLSLAQALDESGTTLAFAALTRPVALPPLAKPILAAMNGKRRIGDIRALIATDEKSFDSALNSLTTVLGAADLLWISKHLKADYGGAMSPPMLTR